MTDKEIFEYLTKDAPPFDPDKCGKLYLGTNIHLTVGVLHTSKYQSIAISSDTSSPTVLNSSSDGASM